MWAFLDKLLALGFATGRNTSASAAGGSACRSSSGTRSSADMTEPTHVVIAGGGVAALETLTGVLG